MLESHKNRNLGIILVIVGGLFYLGRVIDFSHLFWPLYIIGPGVLLFLLALSGGRKSSGLAIPASIVTAIGLILFSQNITGNFESWAYAWALIPAASGLGMVIMSNLNDDFAMQEKGYKAIKSGLSMFLVFGVFFELFIFHSWMNSGVIAYLLPIGLIAIGIYMLKKPAGNYVYLPEKDDEFDDDDDDDD